MQSNTRRILIFLPAFIITSAVARAQPANQLSPDDLALGLDKLHWGMAVGDVAALYPALREKAKFPGEPTTNQMPRYFDGYSYAGCNFHIAFYFSQMKLDFLALDAVGGSAACSDAIKNELIGRYGTVAKGGGLHTAPPMNILHGEWDGPVTSVVFNGEAPAWLEVTFKETNGTALEIIN